MRAPRHALVRPSLFVGWMRLAAVIGRGRFGDSMSAVKDIELRELAREA